MTSELSLVDSFLVLTTLWHYSVTILTSKYAAIIIFIYCLLEMPVTVAERRKAWTLFDRADAGPVDSNPTLGMDV
jgi:hypothetical protein